MPRHARMYLETPFFHVMVQGIKRERIFREAVYKDKYIELLRKYLKNSKIKIISFCIMSNHLHLLVNTENVANLSNFMHKINSLYAKYYNYMEGERVGYVFRDRYKSEPIRDRKHLIRCAKYIHQNPVKAGIVVSAEDYLYSSYDYFKKHLLNHDIFSKEEMEYICNEKIPCEDDFMDDEQGGSSEVKIQEGVEQFIKKENIKVLEIFENRDILKKLIQYLRTEKKTKYIDIRKYFSISRWGLDKLK